LQPTTGTGEKRKKKEEGKPILPSPGMGPEKKKRGGRRQTSVGEQKKGGGEGKKGSLPFYTWISSTGPGKGKREKEDKQTVLPSVCMKGKRRGREKGGRKKRGGMATISLPLDRPGEEGNGGEKRWKTCLSARQLIRGMTERRRRRGERGSKNPSFFTREKEKGACLDFRL